MLGPVGLRPATGGPRQELRRGGAGGNKTPGRFGPSAPDEDPFPRPKIPAAPGRWGSSLQNQGLGLSGAAGHVPGSVKNKKKNPPIQGPKRKKKQFPRGMVAPGGVLLGPGGVWATAHWAVSGEPQGHHGRPATEKLEQGGAGLQGSEESGGCAVKGAGSSLSGAGAGSGRQSERNQGEAEARGETRGAGQPLGPARERGSPHCRAPMGGTARGEGGGVGFGGVIYGRAGAPWGPAFVFGKNWRRPGGDRRERGDFRRGKGAGS